MENSKIKSFTGQVQLLLKTLDFPQKLKQRLVLESNNVTNPYKFIAGLFTEGVLSDGSSDPEASFGLKEMMVQLAITIACSKGADAIGGLMKALEGSGNSQLISALRTWANQEFGIEIDTETSGSKERASAVLTPPAGKLPQNVIRSTESSSIGIMLIDKITSHVEDNLMEELERHLVCKASDIENTSKFCASLVHQNVLEETEIQRATGPEVRGRQQIEKSIKVACSKKAIGSLVLALDSSNNKRILAETYNWLEASQARKKNYPISVKSLARQARPSATGLFAATQTGLIALDLRTFDATALTSECTLAVAVNHNLKKVYWSESYPNSRIVRSNFDGSAKEEIAPETGGVIYMLAIDEATGNVHSALLGSHEIKVCNAVRKNCAVVVSNSSLVKFPDGIVLDSAKGFLYWGQRGSNPDSLVRANLDGTNAAIISTGFKNIQGITLDPHSNDVLYWADGGENTIGNFDVNSGSKQTLVQLEGNPRPYGIQVDASKIYIGNCYGKSIQSVDRDCGKELTTIYKSTGHVYHLALFHSPVKQS